ncbi:MAG: ABC transporter substrate-binding protein [Micromonosporaceae bacterium]|nr:ABC transporter substrate-binding protein [Micromonosporaceae bacterium]
MKPTPLIRAAAALALALGLVGCGGDAGSGDDTYTIGLFTPLTGFAAGDGKSSRTAAKLGVDKLNADGGIGGKKLALKVYDDASKPDQAATLVRKMIQQDGVDVVVSGSYSAQTRAAAPIVARADKLMVVGYAVDPSITEAGESIWRVGELASIQGKVGGELVTKNLAAKRVAILQVDNDFGASLVAAFRPYVESKGAQVVYRTKYPLDEKDYRPILSAANKARPDVIYAPGYYNNGADILKQAKELGVTAQIVGVEGYDSPNLIELAGQAADGVIITTELNRDSESDVVQSFITDYEKASGGRPADAVAAEVYDAVIIAGKALDDAGGADTEKLVGALENLDDFSDTTTEITKFDAERNAIRPGLAQVVKNGEFQFYASFDDPAVIEAG